MSREKILDELIHLRTGRPLDDALKEDKGYQDALRHQDKAFAKLDRIKWSRKQHRIIDNAISADNACGAAYGAIAYRLGLEDGIRLVRELMGIV